MIPDTPAIREALRRQWPALMAGVFVFAWLLAALVFGGEFGQAYLGTQGDVWDAQKDSAMALSGALAAAALAVAWARVRQARRDPGMLRA